MELTNQQVVLNFRQLAHLKQKLLDMRKDIKFTTPTASEIDSKIQDVIEHIHTLAGCSTIWEEEYEEQDRLRAEKLKAGQQK
jgi:hypothetical protein